MLNDLLALEEGLTDWEVDFVDSVDRQHRERTNHTPSTKQKAKILELYRKHCL